MIFSHKSLYKEKMHDRPVSMVHSINIIIRRKAVIVCLMLYLLLICPFLKV